MEHWVLPTLIAVLGTVAVARIIFGWHRTVTYRSLSLPLKRVVFRRIGDFLVQSLLLSSAYLLACLAWPHAALLSTVFCLVGIGFISRHLLGHIFVGRGFLGADRAFSPQVVASGYYLHFIRNYMYITWLFACCALGLHSHSLAEGPAYLVTNSSGSNLVDFLYYTVVTMSTLGYGDINPVSKGAKLLAVLQVFVGVFILLTYAGAIISHYLARVEDEDKKQTEPVDGEGLGSAGAPPSPSS